MNDAVRMLLAAALERSEVEVPEDAAVGTWEAWDSLGHVRVVLALEEQLGRRLTTDEIVSIHAASDVERILAS